jgi:hypothetical protein
LVTWSRPFNGWTRSKTLRDKGGLPRVPLARVVPSPTSGVHPPRRLIMLWTIAVLLLVLWALGVVTAHTIGGFIHILLLLAIVAVLIRIIQGRRPI